MSCVTGLEQATASAQGALGLVVHLGAWQVRRQRRATRNLCGFLGARHHGELFELLLDGRDVGVHGLVQQTALLGVQALAARGELPAPQHGDLVGELIDLGLLEVGLAVLGGDDLVVRLDDALLVTSAFDQAAHQRAELRSVDSGEVIDIIELGRIQDDLDGAAQASSCLSGQPPIAGTWQ